jgi:hypothetical protein
MSDSRTAAQRATRGDGLTFDPAVLVRALVDCVAPNSGEVPDLFAGEAGALGRNGDRAVPARLHGLLARLAEEEREIARRFEWQRGALIQEAISRGMNQNTATDNGLRSLNQKEEAERSKLREDWYCGLSAQDKAAVDNLCLTVADTTVRQCFPASVVPSLHAPLARLAIEDAALGRRCAARRNVMERRLVNRGAGPTVVRSMLSALAHDEEDAKLRLIGRWFRELTPGQQAAFDGTEQKSAAERSASTPGRSQQRGKGKGIREKMQAYMRDHPEDYYDLTSREFASKFRCQASTVVDTPEWKAIMHARAAREADRANRHNYKPGDKRKLKRRRSDA